MNTEINRYYLEIHSSQEINELKTLLPEYQISNIAPPNFKLNKFFYKNIGKKHQWTDRLIWSDTQWIDYVENEKVDTFILKKNEDMAGYFELIHHKDINEVEKSENSGVQSHYIFSNIPKLSQFSLLPTFAWYYFCGTATKDRYNCLDLQHTNKNSVIIVTFNDKPRRKDTLHFKVGLTHDKNNRPDIEKALKEDLKTRIHALEISID